MIFSRNGRRFALKKHMAHVRTQKRSQKTTRKRRQRTRLGRVSKNMLRSFKAFLASNWTLFKKKRNITKFIFYERWFFGQPRESITSGREWPTRRSLSLSGALWREGRVWPPRTVHRCNRKALRNNWTWIERRASLKMTLVFLGKVDGYCHLNKMENLGRWTVLVKTKKKWDESELSVAYEFI